MKYCLIKDGVIVKYNVSQKNTGLGVNSSKERYLADGWYEVVDKKPSYDSGLQTISSVYNIVGDTVVREYSLHDISQETLISTKIKKGEEFVNGIITSKLDTFNKTHGTIFTKVNDMGIYIVDDTYYLQAECKELITWHNLLWATSRQNQDSVLSGNMSEDDFKELLKAV